jgi:hypothetical protein
VQLGENHVPVLFLFAIQAAVESMNSKWPFRKPDLSITSISYTNTRDSPRKVKLAIGPSMQMMLRLSFYREKSFLMDPLSLRHSSLDSAWLFTSAQRSEVEQPQRPKPCISQSGVCQLIYRKPRTTMSETMATSSPSAIHFDILET